MLSYVDFIKQLRQHKHNSNDYTGEAGFLSLILAIYFPSNLPVLISKMKSIRLQKVKSFDKVTCTLLNISGIVIISKDRLGCIK